MNARYHAVELAWAEAFGRAEAVARKINQQEAQRRAVAAAWDAPARPVHQTPPAAEERPGGHPRQSGRSPA